MYRHRNIIIFVFTGLLCLWACSPTKDKWLNRNYHTLTGHYNVYFNGEQKLLDAITQLESSHINNFNKVLDVFPTGSADAAKAAGNTLDEAIKKFSKTIQMHTIGSFTDDAYFGIGQCRFYKQDYFASIETFQYILGKYKKGEFEDASTCFIARNYVGMNKLNEAEALMSQVIAKKVFKKEDIALVYATAADINIKQEKYASAIENLKLALKGKLTKDQKIRYNYILGQLCLMAGKKPEAGYFFNKVISFIPPYDFALNANLGLTNIYDLNDPRSIERVKRNLRKMANDEKNVDYLDQIYYEMGRLDMAQKNYPEAAKDFKKSVASSKKNQNQKGLSYYELAKLYFDRKEYKNAQAYYDSTVQFMDKQAKPYEQIKETKAVLSDLINNLNVYETEDSLQKLALLSNDELDRKINSWIAEEKRKEELAAKEAKKRAKAQASMANNQNLGPATTTALPGAGDNSWYFYNPSLVSAGAAEFFSNKKWGQRVNEDYWRLSAKEKPRVEPSATPTDTANAGKANDASGPKEITQATPKESSTGNADKDKWIKNVPFTKDQKARSNTKILESLHNLGVLYYERLKNAAESKRYFEILQSRFPASEYEPESFYYLFKTNGELKNNKVAEGFKENLILKYPDHHLALLVQNKTIQSAENTNNKLLMAAYENMYEAYKANDCAKVMQMKADIDKQFPGNNMKPKIDLMNALCIGKSQNKEQFKKALQEVSATYKGMDVAKTADDYLEVMNREERKSTFIGKDTNAASLTEFDMDTETPFYYVLAVKNTKLDFNEFVAQYTALNDAYASESNLRVNAIMSNEGYQLITIREFPNYKAAYEYYKIVKATNFKATKLNYTEASPEYIISTKNFRIVLKDKKVEKFAEFYKKQEALLNPKK